MYCGYCGAKLKENAKFCGKCGREVRIPVKQEIVYVEEKPIDSILNNTAVVLLTFGILVLSIATIICTSLITKDIPSTDRLSPSYEEVDLV